MTQASPFQPNPFPTTEEVFGPTGLLAQQFPGYVPRTGQLTMTLAVDEAYRDRKRALIEGPTGTGKTVAYLVPAIRAYAREGTKTIVATSNIALQEQIVRKDLPLLLRTLRRPFRFALLKGTSNYVCRESLEEAMLDPASPFEVRDVASFVQTSQTGDLSDLDHELAPRTRQLCTTSSEDCLGSKCPSYEPCFVQISRTAARTAQIIVVNYHLFFADLALRADGQKGILPDHNAVVLDELHNAAEIARSFFGSRLTHGSVMSISRRLLSIRAELAKELERFSRQFFDELEQHRRSDHYLARLRTKAVAESDALVHALKVSAKVLRDAMMGHEDARQVKRLEAAANTADKQAALVTAGMNLTDEGSIVYSIEPPEGQKSCALVSQPIDVSSLLRANIWDSERLATVIGTSATLGDGKTFDLVAREVGADAAKQLAVPSPFDWPNQAVVVIPPGLPLPADRDWPASVCDALYEAVRAASGRTLGLFTSRKMLETARDDLRRRGLPYEILCQGEAPRTKLVEQFRRDISSVLLGTSSLWEGVDVQGEALSCVVIDKLPFDSPDDPVASVLNEKSRNYFKQIMLPRAVLRFRQGAGRLIRTTTDRGAIVLLDDRVISKPYGVKFLRGLPEGVRVIKGSTWAGQLAGFLDHGEPF